MRLDSASRPRTLGAEKFYGGGWTAPTRIRGQADPRFRIPMQWMQDRANWESQAENQLRSVERSGFSQSSSSDRLTDEQREDLIAENIYDWWISGKSYKKWYADKFLQTKLEFAEDDETRTSEENNGVK